MFVFVSCILIATSALANDWGSYSRQTYQDQDGIEAKIHPDTNFYYNFEQMRDDQPSQVEVREENLRRYMHSQPTTTTTTSTTPIPEVQPVPQYLQEAPVRSNYNELHVPDASRIPNARYSHINIPPPPNPKWLNLNQDIHHQGVSRLHPIASWNVQPSTTSTTAPVFTAIQWSDPTQNRQHLPAISVPELPSRIAEAIPSPAEFIPQQTAHSSLPENIVSPAQFAPHQLGSEEHDKPYRGSHKFQWNDVTTPPSQDVSRQPEVQRVTEQAPPTRGPPPPPPTLSPWSGDNFGK